MHYSYEVPTLKFVGFLKQHNVCFKNISFFASTTGCGPRLILYYQKYYYYTKKGRQFKFFSRILYYKPCRSLVRVMQFVNKLTIYCCNLIIII